MNPTPARITAFNHAFNHQVHACRDMAAGRIVWAHEKMRSEAPSPQHLGRVGCAMALNAVWGFKEGAKYSFPVALVCGTPRLPLGAHALRLPTGLGFGFGVGGIAALGYLMVGAHSPLTEVERQSPHIVRTHRNFEDGFVGTALIRGLEGQAHQAARQHRPNLAKACMWGAAFVSVCATVVRLGVVALMAAMALGLGFAAAVVSAIVAGAWQLCRPEYPDVVDFQIVNEVFTRR